MTTPLEPGASATVAEPEAILSGQQAIEGRSLGQIAWRRLRRDRWAVAGAIVVVILALVAIFANQLIDWFGQPIDHYNDNLINPNLLTPYGNFGGISLHHLLGVEPKTGRDLFSRIVDGARVSLGVGFLATLVSVIIGVLLGVIAGYYGGWVDTVLSRTMDVFLAFPVLMFAIAISAVLQNKAFGLSGNTLHITALVFVIGFFNWAYIARIVRGQVLSLREREFVDAARSLGASGSYIVLRELLPNLIGPIVVYATLLIPTNILFEATLDFLGVGVQPPMQSWGTELTDAVNYYQADPMYMVVPGLAIFITVLAFNLLGDGLQDALDPRGR
jgi:peptide/nickel transport system permease protein